MIFKLTDKHLKKLAIITDLPLEKVSELSSMGLINSSRALALMMKYDWKLLMKQANTMPSSIRIRAIMDEYNVSENRVKEAVYSGRVVEFFCRECGKKILMGDYTKYHGLCEDCAVKSIKIQ